MALLKKSTYPTSNNSSYLPSVLVAQGESGPIIVDGDGNTGAE